MTDIDTGRGDDGWGVTDEYDVAEFYTKATDGRGHSDNLRVRVKPEVAGEVAALVAAGRIPEYTTPQDFIRDAIVHRLRWLSEHTDDPALNARLAEAVRRTVIEETTARYLGLIESFEEFLARTHQFCEKALVWGDHDGVARYLVDAKEFAANIRDPYSARLTEVINHYESRVNVIEVVDVPLDGGLGEIEEAS